MNRSKVQRVDWVEALESRRMFSIAHPAPVVDPAAVMSAVLAMPQATTPSVVGTYTGMVIDSNEKSPGVMTTVIETQSSRGDITGYVQSKYPGEHTRTTEFTGKIRGDTITISTGTTTVTATVSDNGHVVSGSYVYQGSGDSSVGRFVVTRHS